MSGTSSSRPATILSVQYLRAAAALAVVVFHAMESTATKFPVGAAGVDVFFVISGFIMWTLTAPAQIRGSAFLWRRFIRIAPPYWIATLLAAALAVVRPGFLWAPPFDAADLLRSLAFVPYMDDWGRTYPVLVQGWTLNYEMFFYLVFAAALFAPLRWRLAGLSVFFLALAAAGLLMVHRGPAAATYTDLQVLEFVMGAWLGEAWLRGRLGGVRLGVALIATALAAFAATQMLGLREGPWRVLYWGLPALGLVSGGLCLERAGLIGRWRIPKALGDGSYSIYLFHLFALAVVDRVLAQAPIALRVGAGTVAAAAAGYVLFLALERPMTAALRRLPKAFSGRPGAVARAPAGS